MSLISMAQSSWWLPRNILRSSELKQRKHSCWSCPVRTFLAVFLLQYSPALLLNILGRQNVGNGQGRLDRQTGNKREPFFLSRRFMLALPSAHHNTSTGQNCLMINVWWSLQSVDKLSRSWLAVLNFYFCNIGNVRKWSSDGGLTRYKLKPLKPKYLFVFDSK